MQLWPYNDRFAPGILLCDSSHVTMISTSVAATRVQYNKRHQRIHLVNNGRLGGVVEGNGVPWWNACFENALPDQGCNDQPKLIQFQGCPVVLVERPVLLNSPFWTLTLDAVRSKLQLWKLLVC